MFLTERGIATRRAASLPDGDAIQRRIAAVVGPFGRGPPPLDVCTAHVGLVPFRDTNNTIGSHHVRGAILPSAGCTVHALVKLNTRNPGGYRTTTRLRSKSAVLPFFPTHP